ncbi:hypothetical protein BX600DRAFT_391253 [Xylariales sp. PMI_506]|nr:hypothetical protein BX600DRAFT_391253 [Xylariales sp. PMI_506]
MGSLGYESRTYDVVIIGAGVVGLTLAQALQNNGLSCVLLERDPHIDARGNGWGITIGWAKEDLQKCLPSNLFDALPSLTVDHEMSTKDTGHYKYINLTTLEHRFYSPAHKGRLRIRREGLRKLLMKDVEVRWGAKPTDIDFNSGAGAKVHMQDGSSVSGKLVIGADGSGSWTRRFLCPETGALMRLPILFIGVIVKLSPTQYAPIQMIDPLMFQGTCEKSDVYMYMNVLSTPITNGSQGTEDPHYTAQCSISWKPKYDGEEVPSTSAERLKRMRELCSEMHPSISNMVKEIPEGSEAIEVKLQDWPCLEWPNFEGQVTLAGDAAHAMTMYRGEAANHGIADAAILFPRLIAVKEGKMSQQQAITDYETEVRARAIKGVLMSRQACMDAHSLADLKDDSPVLSLN